MSRGAPPEGSRVIVFHTLAHARAALATAEAANLPIVLMTAPGAAAYAGSQYLKAIVERAVEAHPAASVEAVIDCGEDAGHAMGALRIGWQAVLFTGAAEVAVKLDDIAAQSGARLLTEPPAGPTLDLLDAADPSAVCHEFLSRIES